jgi:hypothetical protein
MIRQGSLRKKDWRILRWVVQFLGINILEYILVPNANYSIVLLATLVQQRTPMKMGSVFVSNMKRQNPIKPKQTLLFSSSCCPILHLIGVSHDPVVGAAGFTLSCAI